MPFGLGLGILFLSLYDGRSANRFSLLTGQIVSVQTGQLGWLIVISAFVLLGMLLIWRPLRFDSLDPQSAAARGVPTTAVSLAFMLLLGLIVAVSVHIIGALLVMALLVTPAAAAMRIATGPIAVPGARRGVRLRLGRRRHPARDHGNAAGQPLHHDDLVRHLSRLPRHRRAPRPRDARDRCAPLPGAHSEPLGRIRHMAQRNTWQRDRVREALGDARGFVSAQSLHATLREENTGIGLATVYRALAGLAAQGDADSLQSPDGESLYRACKTPGHHHHLICRSCGLTVEIEATDVEQWARQTAARARLQRGRARGRHLRAVRAVRAGRSERA